MLVGRFINKYKLGVYMKTFREYANESLFNDHLTGDAHQDYLESIGSELQFILPNENGMKKLYSMTKFERSKSSYFIQVKFNGKEFNRVLIIKAKSGKEKTYDVTYGKKRNKWNEFEPDLNVPRNKLRALIDTKLSKS